jgi:hypothetical protein
VEYILFRAVKESVNIPIGDIPLITLHGDDEDEIGFMKCEFEGVFPWEEDKGESMAGQHLVWHPEGQASLMLT